MAVAGPTVEHFDVRVRARARRLVTLASEVTERLLLLHVRGNAVALVPTAHRHVAGEDFAISLVVELRDVVVACRRAARLRDEPFGLPHATRDAVLGDLLVEGAVVRSRVAARARRLKECVGRIRRFLRRSGDVATIR